MRLPRKVLHVMNAAAGGAALSTLGLIGELGKLGVGSCAVCHDAGTPAEHRALEDATGGEVVFTSLYWWNRKVRAARWKRPALEALQLARTGAGLNSLRTVVRAVRAFGADLIHTNTLLTPEGGRAARVLGLPHVWHVRELTGPGAPFQLPLRGEALTRYLLAHASMVVANSAASAAPLESLAWAGRLTVVPNGIELDPFERIPERPAGTVVVGMLANLTSRTKKHGLFVEAAARVTEAEFRIYGHAPAEGSDAYADRLRGECAAANVKIMGFVPAPEALAGIDVLVQPADNESFGRTVIEAMAAGRPVIGAAGGGVGETIVDGESGLLFPPDDAAALAERVRQLSRNPDLRRRLGDQGRKRARASYSLAACAKRIAVVYQAALNAPVESGWTSLSLIGGLT